MFEKWIAWARLAMLTSFAQVLVQGVGFICGILVVRILPTEEYALYTLANTMLGTMTILADGGICAGVMAEGGKVWQDKKALGAVVNTGIYLRGRFAFISLLIATPALFYLLNTNGASWTMSILIVLSLLPAFFTALSGKILEIVPKLHQDVGALQKAYLLGNVGRLALLTLTIFVFPWAYIAIIATSLPQIWVNIRLRKLSKKFSLPQAPKVKDVQDRLLELVKRMMPGAIYYVISGQIMVWLISIFGNANGIAQIGALSRFVIVLSVIQSVLSILIVPYFSKIQHDRKATIQLFWLLQAGLLVFSAITILFAWTFPDLLLSILGDQYKGLSFELVLMIMNACVALQCNSTFYVISGVGVVPSPVWMISFLTTLQIVLFFMLDFSIVAHVILFSMIVSAFTLVYYVVYFLRKLYLDSVV